MYSQDMTPEQIAEHELRPGRVLTTQEVDKLAVKPPMQLTDRELIDLLATTGAYMRAKNVEKPKDD